MALSMMPVVGNATQWGSDAYWMGEALAQARMALTIEEVPVGAIVVNAGEVISRACNRNRTDNDPCAHAEILALRQAAQQIANYRLTDATLFVTLEPCFMCAGAIIHARVKRVVFAAYDHRAGAVGSIANILQTPMLNHTCEVTAGIREEESVALLQSYFQLRRTAGSL
jgi:tRNA(adenine34) deaminase